MAFFGKKIGIDLGTSYTRIYLPRKGIVVNEPSVVAKSETTDKIVAVGHEALEMIGRTPESLRAYYPLKRGVIADFGAAEHMLRTFMQRATGRFHIQKPEAMTTVSVSATSTERRAVIEVGKEAGMQHVYLIYSPIAAALGAGLPIIEPKGHMIINIGAGTVEIAVLSLGGVVAKHAVRTGGYNIDDTLVKYLRRTHNLTIGATTGEDIKLDIGCLADKCKDQEMAVRGRSLVEGLPKTITITNRDIRPHIESVFEKILIGARKVLEKTPPDLVSDIVQNGIMLSGGSAQLRGIDEYLSHKLNAPCLVAQDPQICGVKGTHIALTHLEDYKRSLLGL